MLALNKPQRPRAESESHDKTENSCCTQGWRLHVCKREILQANAVGFFWMGVQPQRPLLDEVV